jgi:hypothetical protein
MIANSELIVLAQVVESTSMFSRVRSVETFRGSAPMSDFVVTGYNDPCWPKADRDRETLQPKSQHLLFLQRVEPNLPPGDVRIAADNCGGDDIAPKAWRHWPRYAVPSPWIGEYPVETRGVASDSQFCSSCAANLRVPVAVAFPILRALAQPNEPDVVATGLKLLNEALTERLVQIADSDPAAKAQLAWLLEGQAAFGTSNRQNALMLALKSSQGDVRQLAVRALPSLGASSEVHQLLTEVLRNCQDKDADALQVEATRALVRLDPTGALAVPRIIASLPNSCPTEAVHRDGTDPTDRTWVSAREVMVRSLTRYRANQAEAPLISLLQQASNAPGTFDAIMDHFMAFRSQRATAALLERYRGLPPEQLARFNRYFVDVGDATAQGVMFDRMLHETVAVKMALVMLRYYALHSPHGDPRLEGAVQRLLKVHAGDAELASLSPLALSLDNAALVRQLLQFDPEAAGLDGKTRERVARAVQLQHTAFTHPEVRARAWLQLLIDDRWSRHATPFFLREYVCSAPPSLMPDLARWLAREQLEGLSVPVGNAIAVPGATATSKHTRTGEPMEEYRCLAARTSMPSALAPHLTGKIELTAPRRSGCGAGCAAQPPNSNALAWATLVLALAMVRRASRRANHRL